MKPRILVVDDEESIRFTFDTFLTNDGYDVSCADGFEAAIELLREAPPDIVISDIILGDRSGLDLLAHIHELQLDCPIIMITGQPSINTAAESVRRGAFDYLLKPIRKESLLGAARNALKHKAVVDERNRIQAENDRLRNHLEAVFRSVDEVIVTVDRDGRIVQANDSVRIVSRQTAQELRGRLFHEIDDVCFRACRDIVFNVLQNGRAIQAQPLTVRYPDQPRQTLLVSGAPLLDRNRNSMGALLVIRDNTRNSDLELQIREQRRIDEIIGSSSRIQEVFRLINALADTDASVLITGESGTGKGLVAKALHNRSSRAAFPFMTVSCSVLSENLLESELFGHVKGAFTGAVNDKIGRFEACHNGTLFLDEIGEISPGIQVKLLRFLQDREFERVGNNQPIKVDVRIIAATNRKLKQEVEAGNFREDLYYRLRVVEIPLPPLRERRDDIPMLVRHFSEVFARKYKKPVIRADESAMQTLSAYSWPGNVRELEHALEHALVLCADNMIRQEHLPPEIRHSGPAARVQAANAGGGHERDDLISVLEKAAGNKAMAARMMGVSRQTFYRKLKKYGLDT